MKKPPLNRRIGLTLLFIFIVGIIMFLSEILVSILMYLLLQTELLFRTDNTIPSSALVVITALFANFIVGILLSVPLSRYPLKPINELINKLNLLAAGKYKTRIQTEGISGKYPAFVELADSFNTLANELEHTEMLREDFINNFSHEFKTPIVSIAGFAKLLQKGNLSTEEQKEYIQVIEEESLRLSNMATNVLNLTKVENQTILTDTTTYNLSEQIRACILILEKKWEKKQLSFSVDFDEYTITANEELLKQVWLNLIDNAIKFSPKDRTIWIDIAQGTDLTTISITNEGSSIDPEHQKRIFHKFYQADESHAKEGNGIGLSIVKRVVELHGGEILLSSQNDHTTFVIKLPAEV